MKKTIVTFACFVLIGASAFAALPNDKVLQTFNSTFNHAREVRWSDHTDYYEVSFVQSQIRATIKYDLKGNFISAIRYYTKENLPGNILAQIKSRYPDKSIFGITELTGNEEISYFVKLQDKKNWITVKVRGSGGMEIIEKYRKA